MTNKNQIFKFHNRYIYNRLIQLPPTTCTTSKFVSPRPDTSKSTTRLPPSKCYSKRYSNNIRFKSITNVSSPKKDALWVPATDLISILKVLLRRLTVMIIIILIIWKKECIYSTTNKCLRPTLSKKPKNNLSNNKAKLFSTRDVNTVKDYDRISTNWSHWQKNSVTSKLYKFLPTSLS